MQADPEVEKFGDIQLFEALAVDDAVCVWRDKGGEPDASILTDYAASTTAEHNQKRFKVPAYRHPDALLHPVFCDFGNSRWTISFACHEAAKARSSGKRVAEDDCEWIKDRYALRMGLWDGQIVDDVGLRWSSKRLTANLGLEDDADARATGVTRADRLGRTASGAFGHATIINVFEEQDWNGRLQAPRAQLDRIATLMDKGKHRQADTLRQRLRWLVSFSPRLRPSGPFIEYAASHGIEPNRKGEYYPNASVNKGREGSAKLALSRLPGLRVLSVDLGHRFAAACAVWETLPPAAFKKEIAGLKVLAGGSGQDDLYLHVEKVGKDHKPRTVIYRRIGPDKLSEGDHPARWARLDRQFLIKLQGEVEPARCAAPQETDMVRGWEQTLGRVRNGTGPDEKYDALPHRVDLLMSDAVTTLTRALRRHGDRARIAFNLTTREKLTPDGGRQLLDRVGRAGLLAETLVLWHGLFSGKRWTDPWAAEEWKKRGLPAITAPDDAEEAAGAARRARREALEASLRPHAERLADQDLSACSVAWNARWKQDDAAWCRREGILRSLKRWIAPRGLRPLPTDDDATGARKKADRAAARNVGGLSVTRINTVSSLYQILKAFKMRPEPADLRKNIPKKGDDELADYNRRLLDMRDRLREQRVKQLASRIVEAALGLGRIKGESVVAGVARPRARVDAPCHAVVIESLRHYRPDDLRTRRENRQLMQWSSGKVQKHLKEGCQLYGLYLREVPANYTSRQCSRTGLPGLRCEDVAVEGFLTAPWWNRAVNAARMKVGKHSTDAEAHFLANLADRLMKLKSEGNLLPPIVRVPRQGGDLFVPAPPLSCRSDGHKPCPLCNGKRALQADLNAAANIGLRALMDSDFPGKWWYVPCIEGKETAAAMPRSDRVKGSACFGGDPTQFGSLRMVVEGAAMEGSVTSDRKSGRKVTKRGQGKETSQGDAGETTNYWCDPSARDLRPAVKGGFWLPTPAYWHWVRGRVLAALRQTNAFPDRGAASPDSSGARHG